MLSSWQTLQQGREGRGQSVRELAKLSAFGSGSDEEAWQSLSVGTCRQSW